MRAIGLVPGASTHNAGETVPAMAGYDVAVVNTPVNRIGWRMCPCPEDALRALANTDKRVIGMKPLAMGRVTPVEGMEYALARPEVDIVLVGAASPEEARETFGAAQRVLGATVSDTGLTS
jgi:predicted aldo/keto reductase-like oxidoreductase